MYKDNHLKIAHSLHHLLIQDLINHQHLPYAFLLSNSDIPLLKGNWTVALVKVEEPFLLGPHHCPHVSIVGECG